jgi:hypothetical protein
MPNPNQPSRPKSTDEILREMEQMSGDSGNSSAEASGGALKSLLGLFIKVHDDGAAKTPPVSKPAASTPPPALPKAAPPKRVSDLVADEPAPKFAPASASAGNANTNLAGKNLADIYREAGIPASPCSLDELATLLENPTIASQPVSVKVVAVNLALSAKGINAEAPIADAVRRDRALDAYQAMLLERAQMTQQTNEAKVQQISKEVEEYLKRKQAEMDALRAEATEAKRQAVEFSVRREAEEKRMAELIAPFLEGKPNPVTVGNSPEPASPPLTKQ